MTTSFETYLASLAGLSVHADPTLATAHSEEIRAAAASLAEVPVVTAAALIDWVQRHPAWVPVLGLAVGLSQERLKNALRHRFGTSGWINLAREQADELVSMLDRDYALVRLVADQRGRVYSFGDILAPAPGRARPPPGQGRPVGEWRTRFRLSRSGYAFRISSGLGLLVGTAGRRPVTS